MENERRWGVTPEQYERWQDFAKRMARTCFAALYRRHRKLPKDWILNEVETFFEWLDPDDICTIESWDNSGDYPLGHKNYHAETFSWGTRYADGPCIGDVVRDQEIGAWDEIVNFLPAKVFQKWNRLCGGDTNDRAETIQEEWSERLFGPVHCCLRAGLDNASEPSMGVIGFTAGDLRKMYPEGVPDWVTGGPGHRWEYWPDGGQNGTFAEMPDNLAIHL